MGDRRMRRWFAPLFGLALVAIVGMFAYGASASVGAVEVYSDLGEQPCAVTGGTAPGVYQGGRFQIRLRDFWDEAVVFDVTFPDGRIFTLPASFSLDGVVDMPLNTLPDAVAETNIAGQASGALRVPGEWPYGCYEFMARGISSGKVASGYLAVIPGGQPGANPGLARVRVTRTGSNENFGFQGTFVDINGTGFRAQEVVSIWATAPDGTVLSLTDIDPRFPTQALTDNSGDFQMPFQFDSALPTGTYLFTMLGTSSGYRVIVPFTLNAQQSLPKGWARLRVAYPADRSDPQRSVFELQGERFTPGERVDLWITFPDNSVRGFPSQFTDDVGDFFVLAYLDERLPVGFYSVTAKGATSGHLVITSFTLEERDGVGLTLIPITPAVVDSSSDQVGGATP